MTTLFPVHALHAREISIEHLKVVSGMRGMPPHTTG